MKRWPQKSLGELAGCGQYGLNAAAMSEGTGTRFIRITDITHDGDLRHETPAFVPDDTPELDNYELKDGDVLIARSGATVGKSYIHQSFGDRAVFAGYLIRFQPDSAQILPRFIGAFLQTPIYWQQLNSHKRAVAQPNVNAKQLASLVLPVPPLAEQERIVTLLDEAAALRKLRAEANRRVANLIPALFSEMFGDPTTNSLNLPVSEFGSLCKVFGGGTPSKKQPAYWTGKIPWVSPKDMSGDEVHDSEDHISEHAVKESATNLIPTGSILVVTRSGILKHTLPVAVNSVPVTINQDIKAFVPSGGCESTFLAAQLRVLAPAILDTVRVGATVQNLETDALKRLSMLCPPLSLQKEFAARVSKIRELEAGQAASRQRLDDLFQSMLHRAFNGGL